MRCHEKALLMLVFILTVAFAAFAGYRDGVKDGLKIEPTEVLMDLCLHGSRIIHEGKTWEVACFPKAY